MAILGYSHYLGGGQDHVDLTVSLFDANHPDHQSDDDIPYLRTISASFGAVHPSFWQDVIFLNLIPEAIGSAYEKFKWAPHELAIAGSKRLFHLLEKNNVDKLFVFSAKAWQSLPDMTLSRDLPLSKESPFGYNSFLQVPRTVCFHLRHVAYAPPATLKQMREAVELAMKRSTNEFREDIRKALAV